MDVETVRAYCLEKNGVSEGFPFDLTTLVFKVGGKMFLLMSLDGIPPSIAVKTEPSWSEELRESHSEIQGAYHMNKTHWNSVQLEGLPKDLIFRLIDHSYELILSQFSKKKREEFGY